MISRAGELARLIGQLTQVGGKTAEYGLIVDSGVTLLSCDSYTAVYDSIPGEGAPVGATGVTLESLAALQEAARAARDLKTDAKYVNITAHKGGVLFAFGDTEIHVPYSKTMAEAMVAQIEAWGELPPREGAFHIHPDRLARLGRLKGDNGAMPLSLKVVDNPQPTPGRPPCTMLFRLGRTCRGAIAAIDGQRLGEYLADSGEDTQGVLF